MSILKSLKDILELARDMSVMCSGGLVVQGHPWSYTEFRASLDYMRHLFPKNSEKEGLDGEG